MSALACKPSSAGSYFSLRKKSPPCGKSRHIDRPHSSLSCGYAENGSDRQANQPPFPSCHCTGRTAAARLYRTVGLMQGVPPAPPPLPKADSGYAGAEQGGSVLAAVYSL